MGKKQHTEEEIALSDQTETTPPPPTNGDTEPAKKPSRDKAESFRRVGNDRIAKAIYAMRRLLPLANRAAYTYTDEQAEKVRNVALALAKEVVDAFSVNAASAEPPTTFF